MSILTRRVVRLAVATLVLGASVSLAAPTARAGPAVEGFTLETPTVLLGDSYLLTITCLAPHDLITVEVQGLTGQSFVNFPTPFLVPVPSNDALIYPSAPGQYQITVLCVQQGQQNTATYGPQTLTVEQAPATTPATTPTESLPETGGGTGSAPLLAAALLLLAGLAVVLVTARRSPTA